MPTASILQNQPIRTGSTAKRRWLRFVCVTGTQSLTKRGKLNSGALFLMEVKDDSIHPKPIELQGRSTPPPSDRLHSHDLQLCSSPKLLLSSWTYIHPALLVPRLDHTACYCKSRVQTLLVYRFQLWSQGCKVSKALCSVLHGLEIQEFALDGKLCDLRMSLVLPSTGCVGSLVA